ncbi:MAG: glycosyltransferase family 2 protein [Lachnospiraceae bacterium]
MESKLTVSVIIPTYHPGEQFLQLMNRLQRQTYEIEQICVIHTKTEPFPYMQIVAADKVKLIQIPPEEFDHGGTRNLGAATTKGDIIVYMTQDAIPANRHLIGNLVKAFQEEGAGATYARQVPAKDCSIIERYTRYFNYPKESRVKSETDMKELGIKTFFCSNVCAAYRRSIFESLDGFPERAIFNEDMIFAGKIIQSGYKIVYCGEAEVVHSHNYTCVQQLKRNFDVAVSQMEHPEIFEGIPSEKEGMKLVSQTARYLLRIGKPWLLLLLVVKSGFKYIGYFMGKRYKKLPQWMILKLSMNPGYWGNHEKTHF